MKSIKEMNCRELFCLLTGDGDAVQQAMLKQILLDYKAKYPEKVGHFGEMDLAAIVKEMTAE
ncbi:MAG: hypothetical protein IKF55_07190 [Oscillospiraceae bacterium]|nr:hypothetical protein [Oscillospiraceae bacterium]